MIDLGKFVDKYKLIASNDHSLDILRYSQKHFPLYFPNRGLNRLARDKTKVYIHHECLEENIINELVRKDTKVFIDNLGDSGQREYIFLMSGSRHEANQQVEFRGVLGYNRLEEIILTILLSGINHNNIVILDKNPLYKNIISNDLISIRNLELDSIIVGGSIVFKEFLRNDKKFKLVSKNRGRILSTELYVYNGRNYIFTTYPYADLCEIVIKELTHFNFNRIFFFGSCGYIGDYKNRQIGDILAPTKIINEDGTNIQIYHNNRFVERETNTVHGLAKTIQEETLQFIKTLKVKGVQSIDMEVAYFQNGLEKYFKDKRIEVGILVYIMDFPGTSLTYDNVSYHDDKIILARKNLFSNFLNYISII